MPQVQQRAVPQPDLEQQPGLPERSTGTEERVVEHTDPLGEGAVEASELPGDVVDHDV